MPLISIIMPVYNVKAFVGRTIESVLNQTLTDFEFWAVDDGSSDNSGVLCDNYAQKDSRLHVIHQHNQGAPMARNAALDKACGKYVYFIDSDDWIEPDMLQKMWDLAEANQADLVVTGFLMEYYYKGKDVTYKTSCPDRIYDSIGTFRKEAYKYFNASLLSLPWNKLFLLEHIKKNNIRFMQTKWDDHHFCMDYLMDCKNVIFSSMADYHWYRSRKGSETMINYADIHMFEKRKEHYEHILRLYNFWGIHDDSSIDGISSYYAGRLAQCIQELSDNKTITNQERRTKVKEIINDPLTIDTLKKAKMLSKKMRIMVFPMKLKYIGMSLFIGKCISIVRNKMPGLFIRMKEKEVHGA